MIRKSSLVLTLDATIVFLQDNLVRRNGRCSTRTEPRMSILQHGLSKWTGWLTTRSSGHLMSSCSFLLCESTLTFIALRAGHDWTTFGVGYRHENSRVSPASDRKQSLSWRLPTTQVGHEC